ncbi:MAG: hydroxymethylbilane synthase [Terrimicrobiaceae bacterium]
MTSLVLGTRGSALALAQTEIVLGLLTAKHPDLPMETRIIKTTGDERLDIDLTSPGPLGKGLFTKQLEDALLSREIDVAVHSLKDLPVELPAGLVVGAIPERGDFAEVLVSKHPGGIKGLPEGATVATSSHRRECLLKHLRPGLCIQAIRGNVPTRLQKLAEDPALDALVLAKAGLDRLGPHIVPEGLMVTVEPAMLPAPGQGALGLECREDDQETRQVLEAIHDADTARCVNAERALLRAFGGGCAAPLAAHATITQNKVVLRSIYFGETT